MKIDPQSYSACNGELPPLCASLIETIKGASTVERFIEELNHARELQAVLGKTELSRWADVLNRCDEILEDATVIQDHEMKVDRCAITKYNTISILRFTGLLFDCTSTRRIYASTDRIIRLTECTDMDVVSEVLRLLQTISKRSKFLTQRLCPEDQASLVMSLTAMAQCWGGKLRNLKMEDCVHKNVKLPPLFPFTFTDSKAKHTMIFERHMVDHPLLKVIDEFAKGMTPEDRYSLLARIRMLRHFEDQEHRMQCLIVRLLSISTLIYCRCQPDDVQISALLYSGFIEEAVALLKVDLNSHELMDPIQTEALRMLCSVVSLEKASRTSQILDVLSAGSYHGFLAVFTRNIVEEMKRNALNTPGKPSVALSTALLSFIYHLSNNDPGGETLAACGLTQTLLSVISHHALPLDQATLATRCTRITDNFTTIDVTGFNNCKGMDICIDRLIYEVDECRKEQPFVIDTSGDVDDDSVGSVFVRAPVIGKTCHPQRSGLIKALITFIKRAIQDTQFQDSVRHIMEGQLPDALMHIISNSEYYSASLYHHATQLVVNFIYQEPAQLTVLQNRHVPYVILQSMLRKELPNSRDVISHMGNVFTALCLNEKGLKQFKAYAPFDHVFNIVLSIKFIVTMKKKRSEMNEAAQGIGSSLDDLLRHQPTLKPLMLNSVLGMLDRLVELGNNPPPNTKIVMALSRSASKAAIQCFGSGSNTPNVEQHPMSPPEIEEMSDDDDEAEMSMDELSGVGQCVADKMGLEMDCPSDAKDGTRLLPLGDYLLIFTKIFEAIITQVAAADLVEGFVEKNGVEKILSLCNLPSLAADLAASPFSTSVGCIVKFVLQHVKAGDKLMLSIMEVFLQSISPFVMRTSRGYCESNGGASLLVPLGDEGIVTAITSMSNAVPILSMLTKNNSLSVPGTQGDLRNRVWDAWLTDTGKRLHTGFRKVSRVLAWETALLKMIEPTKAVATTQTDPSEIEALSVGTSTPISHSSSEPNNVMSVAVDPPGTAARQPAWAMAGITQAENAFWHRHKNVADMVIKANKTVSEFLSQLSRSCFVPTRRNRRYDFSASTMTKSAQQMADEVFAGFFRDLKWTCHKVPEGGPIPPMEFGRLQEVIVQMSVALFDDRRQPFHAMLQRFYTSGCHNAFCDLMMNKLAPALGNDYNDWLELAFLEWFRLASKLAHKQNMLNTMYRQPQPLTIEFDPKKYLKLVHNDFFRAFCVLFAKLSDEKVDLKCCQTLCETAISVYKDVAHSLTPVSEENQRAPNDELGDPLRTPAADGDDSQRDAVLRQLLPEGSVSLLVDMGFPHELVVQALEETGSTEGATEWLINRNAAGLQQSLERSNDVGDLEEGEFVDANLPFLLGVSVSSSSGASEDREARQTAGTSSSVDLEDSVEMPIITPLKELNIDTDLSISRACIELMPLCKRLMELGSDLVFSCADLVSGMVSTLDEEWRRRHLIGQIMTEEIITMAQSVMNGPSEHSVCVLSTRIHFACLLFDYVADEYLEASASHPMVSTMLLLLGFVYDNFDVDYMQNGLLSPVVLWLDLHDKAKRALKRRTILKSASPQLKWSYHAEEERISAGRSHKKWQPYSPLNQLQLNKAFFSGKTTCVIKIPRKEKDFTVDFTLMKQNDGLACHQAVFAELPDGAEIDLETLMKSERESVWTTAETSRLLVIVVSLLHKSLIHHTAAHTILAFVARLTRDANCAVNFIQQGGIAAVLQLRCSTTPSTSVLTSLIIRQCIDDENMMAQVMEKSVRVVTNPVQSTPLSEYLGMSENKPKDWCETLNKLAPLSTRAPSIFVNSMEKCAKLDGTLMVSTSSKHHFSTPTSNERTQQIVQLLLRECLHGEWPSESSVPLGHTRMISRGAILSLLAELVKSYPGVASLICEAKEDGQSVIHQLIEHFIDGSQDKDTLGSLKTLISILAACNHSPKAQESLVSDMKASLLAVGNSSLSSSAICSKITELCSLLVMMLDSCPSSVTSLSHSHHRHLLGGAPSSISKLFHKKKICNDLVKTITYLQLSQKEAIDTVNTVLKTLETLMRSSNSSNSSANAASITHGARNVARAQAVINAAVADAVRIPSPSNSRDTALSHAIDLGLLANNLLNDARELSNEQDDRNDQMLVRVSDNVYLSDNDQPQENDHHRGEVMDEEMDEEAVEDSMSSGEEDNEDRTVEDEEGDDREEDDTMDGEDQDDEEEEDDEDGRREGDVQATVRVDAEESGEDGEEEEEDDDEEMYDYPEEDEDALHDMTFDLLDRPGLSSFGFDDFIFGPPIGINREHRGARREQSSAGVHPLMVRPAHIADSQPSHNQQSAPTVSRLERIARLGNYRSLLLDSGSGGIPVTLTRQNAIRRIGTTDRGRVGPTSQFFDRLFDLHARDRGGPLMNMTAGRIVSMGSNLLDSPEERRMRQPASAPSALDRYTDGADMMDGVSMQYVAIIINTIVTRVARKHVEEEKAKEAAEQAAKKLLEESSKGTSESPPKASEDTGTSGATATVLAHPPTEVARQAWDESAASGNREADVATALSSGDSVANGDASSLPVVEGEAMDTSDAFEPRDIEADVSMDEAPPHSSAATVASSLPEAEADEERMLTPPLPTVSNSHHEGDDARDASDRSDNSGHTETTTDEPLANGSAARAGAESNPIPEEIREILGDIEIPDGVDPAFLAALPEDMRAEVIRDHRRQQRAQRAAQLPATVPPPGESSGEGASNVAPVVEPLDQEFLAALPPELQEEILAQHERAVREAEEALRRANAPAPPVAPEPEMDGAAVIASLPAHERTQVLAEMDESELQRLPTEMQDEARRARASLEPLQNILRFRHLLMPSSARSRGLRSNVNLAGFGGGFGGMGASGSHGASSSGTPSVGSLAGQANTASTQSLQLLDRDSILILTMLFLVDSRLSNGRLQKVIRLACSHASTCDFVIWCLLALLEKAHDSAPDHEELVSVCPSWLDSITVSGVGHNERALKISKNVSRVAIHPLLSAGLSKNVLDSLATIAKTYPGHFLPFSLRKTSQQAQAKEGTSESPAAPVRDASPPLDLFWELVQASSCKSLAAKEAREGGERMSLESSHMGRLMRHLGKNLVAQNGQVQDRLLRVISSIVQTLPNDTMALLGNLEGPNPLESQLKSVIDVLMRGSCSNEGLADGRTLLVECMRALPPSVTDTVYEQLFTAVQNVGLELQPQIVRLIEELGDPDPNTLADDLPSTSKAPSTATDAESPAGGAGTDRDRRLARTRIGRLVLDAENGGRFTLSASSCPELQLPAVTVLTDKFGAQYKLLSALQTLSKIRDTMRQMKEERRKKEELEKKKKEDEAKAAEAKQSADAKTIDPVAVDETAATSASASESVAGQGESTPMATSTSANDEEQSKTAVEETNEDVVLSHRLTGLDELWEVVSTCLLRLGKASDHHAVLALQPAAEAFFLVHAVPRPANAATDHHHDDPDTLKMIAFAEKHREVLNQVLRQNNTALSPGGPFAALIQFPKLLDFDVKRKYFRKELGKMDGDRGFRRTDVQVQVRRSQIFSDSFRELYRLRPNEWKHRFYIIFQGEEGQDAGGLLREWFSVITREIFNPNYALFITAPGDMVTYMINKASYINPEHLDYFKFVGRLIAKAIYDNKLLDCYFTRAFYKHILNLPVRYQDIESEDPAFYKSLEFLLNNPIDDLGLDLSFSLEVEEFGVRSIRDLKPDGRKIDVTDANKEEYVKLVCQMKMTGSIRKQLDAFLTGFYEVIPKQLISMFNEQELELLISGLPDVDIDDLANNTEYKMYTKTSAQIQWFWRALRSFEPEDRAKFLQFVTGTSKVPLQGFASLEGMNGIQKFSIHMDCRGGDRLPAAHTCFNQLDLPQYESYEKLRDSLLMAIRECTEGFGFA